MKFKSSWHNRSWCTLTSLLVAAGIALVLGGCYAPIHSPGIRAQELPDSYRIPKRAAGEPLNFAALTLPPATDYILGPGDVLDVAIHGLYPGAEFRPVRAQIMASGEIHLPLVGAIRLSGMNLLQAHVAITNAFANGFIRDPRTNVYLVEKATTAVLVLGEVGQPGVYNLPKYENDVAHAIAVAGGLREDAGIQIEVHRRVSPEKAGNSALLKHLRTIEPGGVVQLAPPIVEQLPSPDDPKQIVTIPMYGINAGALSPDDVVLNAGDVVVIPSRKNEIFYVVGRLSPTNFVRFSVGARERDIGAGFVLPRDRDIDVLTAVTMAGYIDPIDSPTTVTLHRRDPLTGESMLVRIDLIKARYDARETMMVEAGDIIYLNPDPWWWSRMTFDRIIPGILTDSFRKGVLSR